MEGQGWPDFEKVPNAEEFRKLFVGGLDKKTTKESLTDYFVTYGEVANCEIKNQGDGGTRSKGFGFITFTEPKSIDEVQNNRPHFVDEKEVETKRATPKSQEYWATKKLYFKDFNKEQDEETLKTELREAFSPFGKITDIKIVKDKDSKTYKGYGFMDFDDEDPVDRFNLLKKIKVGEGFVKVAKAYPKQYQYARGPANYYYDDYYMPPPWYGQPGGYREQWGGGGGQQQRWDRGGYPMYPMRYQQGGRGRGRKN